MQTELLFELTYILLDKKSVTASEMAEHFGVSRRTIYRWLDALNLAGVPVVSVKGKGGGISLSEKYTLDKAILSQEEKLEILSGVQALSVLSGKQNPLISKIKAFSKENADWIKIDFAPWNFKNEEIRSLFTMIKSAILPKSKLNFRIILYLENFLYAKSTHGKSFFVVRLGIFMAFAKTAVNQDILN